MKIRRLAVIYGMRMLFAIVLGIVSIDSLWAAGAETSASAPPSIASLQSTYGKLPLSFEANHGQTDPQVQFLTRGRGHQLFLTSSEAVLTLRSGGTKTNRRTDHASQQKLSSQPSSSHSTVRMKFAGADQQAEVVGLDPLPGIVNYFIGDDPSKWRTNIPTYQKVEYRNLYAGIDLVYYGNQGQLEYDLIVAPGADPTQITLAFDGAEQIAVDAQGDLVLTLPSSSAERAKEAAPTLRLHKPVVYQKDEQGGKHLIASTYVPKTIGTMPVYQAAGLHIHEMQHVAFQIASYDTSKPLIIDPVLSWATYLGGSSFDGANGIVIDTTGNACVTGWTESPNFPGTAGSPSQNSLGGSRDAFVTKLNVGATAILYSTYLGGLGFDSGNGIAVDAAGNAYVTGLAGPGFPGTAASLIQSAHGGVSDAFITKLNAAGTSIVYSTYLGGGGIEEGQGIAVDTAGNAYVTGETSTPGSGFPGTMDSLIQSTFGGYVSEPPNVWGDAFVTKLNAAGTAIVYSTYLGGSGNDKGFGIAVDRVGNVYVTGATNSSGFPGTAGSSIQSTFGGSFGFGDAFVTKINETGTAILYSTYLGGSGEDKGNGIAVDVTGNIYVTGETTTPGSGFPGTATSRIQPSSGGDAAFITKLNVEGTAILYSTYLGGNAYDFGMGIAVDAAGNAYMTGITGSSDFPGTAGSSIQNMHGGASDAFVTKINAAGTAILYSTYLGGSDFDYGMGIAVDTTGNAYIAGATGGGIPGTVASGIQSAHGGAQDAFVAKISSSIPFAAFDARAKIDLNDRRHSSGWSHNPPQYEDAEMRHRPRKDDEFKMTATFTLGSGSNGIDPLKEAVTVQVGTYSTTIPSGSFKQRKGRFVFEGTINGVQLEAVLRSLILGNDYELRIEGNGADLTGTKNPVTVSVTIGDDGGSESITAKIK